jgi:hypothetical protein
MALGTFYQSIRHRNFNGYRMGGSLLFWCLSGCILSLLLYISHPDYKYLSTAQIHHGNSGENLGETWLDSIWKYGTQPSQVYKSASIECSYYGLCSLCKVETIISKRDNDIDHKYKRESSDNYVYYIGILYHWYKIRPIWRTSWPIYHTHKYCNGRGLYLGRIGGNYPRCICLPSWQIDSQCSGTGIPKNFTPIVGENMGWLEILLFAYIGTWLLWRILGYDSKIMNNHFTSSYWNVFSQGRFWTLFTASAVSQPTLVTLILNTVQLYYSGNWMQSRMGLRHSRSIADWIPSFIPMSCIYYFSASIFITTLTILCYRWYGYSLKQPTVYGSMSTWTSVSILRVILQYRSQNIAHSSPLSLLIPLFKLLARQSLTEICFLGEINWPGYLFGSIHAYIFLEIFYSSPINLQNQQFNSFSHGAFGLLW